MKKKFMIIAVATALYSCGNNSSKQKEEKVDSTVAVVADTHNAKNALDYSGTYTGKLPSADGSGMIITITLKDSSYVKETKYVGKSGSFRDTGHYTWNTAGNTITLVGVKNAPSQYFVGENTLTQLDMSGNKITGNLANDYILKKN